MNTETLNDKINVVILNKIFNEDKTGVLKVMSEVMCKHGLPPENLLPCLLEMSACISQYEMKGDQPHNGKHDGRTRE